MDSRFPEELRAGVAALAEHRSRRGLADRATQISEAYRQALPSSVAMSGEADVLAYAMARMPATYAAMARVLDELAARVPGFAPASVLDAGAGPGTASWAAMRRFGSVAGVTLADHSAPFRSLAAALLAEAGEPALVAADIRPLELTAPEDGMAAHDLVLAGYALTELPDAAAETAALWLWSRCRGALVLVEPGRPREYRRLMRIRQALLAAGAAMVAPCPHAGPCPLGGKDWCHFAVRLARSRDHMRLKQASAPFEDEKFSYLIFARPGLDARPASARVIAPPKAGKAAIALPLCDETGVHVETIGRRDRARFRAARHLQWGDAGPGGAETGENAADLM